MGMQDLHSNDYKSYTAKTSHTGGVLATISNEINMLQQSSTLIRSLRLRGCGRPSSKKRASQRGLFFLVLRISVEVYIYIYNNILISLGKSADTLF